MGPGEDIEVYKHGIKCNKPQDSIFQFIDTVDETVAINALDRFAMVIPVGDQHHRALGSTRGQRIVLRIPEHQRA